VDARGFSEHDVAVDITPEQAVADLRRNGAARRANLLFPVWQNEAPSLHAWGAHLADRYPEMTPFGGVLPGDDDPLGVVQEAIEGWPESSPSLRPGLLSLGSPPA
jgi:hypothetical protein